MPIKTIIVSAADDQYAALAQDLVASLRNNTFACDFDIGILDVGFSETGKGWFAAQGVRVEKVKSDIEYPGRQTWEEQKPGFRSLTGRLFMRDYFPGYDIYIWMDADVWVQTPEAIDTLIASASTNPGIHISWELDRCYKTFFESAAVWQIFRDWYHANYGESVAAVMTLKPMLNAGVWAMAKDSPVWEAWIDIYTEALQRLHNLTDKSFMADQLGLNILLYLKKLPYVVMPASFNWMTFHALPMYDRKTGMYVEPAPPYRPLSQIHLTKTIKEQAEKIQCTDGSLIERPLTYRARG